jgi:glutamate-1-semialdehyde aminotransferase
LPLAAFGGSSDSMDAVASGRVRHVGTYNGNPSAWQRRAPCWAKSARRKRPRA